MNRLESVKFMLISFNKEEKKVLPRLDLKELLKKAKKIKAT